jgi:hypothetical protein
MFDISYWSEIANILYIPALVVMYGGWLIRFFQKWHSVMKLPDILLLCFGVGAFTVMAVPKAAPYFAPKTIVIHEQGQPLPPINSMEVTALKTENAQLRTDIARLKRIKQQPRPTVIMASPVPAACPSLPVVSSGSTQKIPQQDCSDLVGAQELFDRAVAAEIAARGTTAHDAALNTANNATDNLNRLAARLCFGYIGPQ